MIKTMPRHQRIDVPRAVPRIIAKGLNRQDIFLGDMPLITGMVARLSLSEPLQINPVSGGGISAGVGALYPFESAQGRNCQRHG